MAVDPRLVFDIFSAVLLFLVAVLGSWLPLHLNRGSKTQQSSGLQTAYHLGNCLSAGVMLSAGFCHLLADALNGLAFVGRFPMANFLAALGYLITLAADQVVHHISSTQGAPAAHDHNGDVELASGDGTMAAGDARCRRDGEKMPLLSDTMDRDASSGAGVDGEGGMRGGKSRNGMLVLGAGTVNGHADGSRGSADRARQKSKSEAGGGSGGGACHSHGLEDSGGHLDVLLTANGPKLHFATAVLLAVALCVHSVLEGMALGAQQSMRSTQDIMLAIAAHKGLAAYALGASVVESGADLKRFWTVTLTFSMATPLAIFVGYGLSTVSSGHGGQALSALASGTFLYVAMMEVIPRELSGAQGAAGPVWMRPAKLGTLMVGFGLMSLLAIWA